MDTFLQHWTSDELLTFERSALEQLKINTEQINFLTEIGLPKDAAPFLTFENELRTLNKLYELNESEFQAKIVIGSDGAGDPICIELTNQQIYACDHEDDFEPRFMNSSVTELFKFLSLFKAFAERLINDRGEDAFIDANSEPLWASPCRARQISLLSCYSPAADIRPIAGRYCPICQMKSDTSLKNSTISAIKRKAMNIDLWLYSRVVEGTETLDYFELDEGELPIFEIRSDLTNTLITTRRIFEGTNKESKSIDLEFIDDVIYGNFKGTPIEPTLSNFRIVDLEGRTYDFQMETGKASMGLIYSINTLRQLKRT